MAAQSVLRMWAEKAALVLALKNWKEAMRALEGGPSPSTLQLRNEILFEQPSDPVMLQMFRDIWVRKVYCPPGFSISRNDLVVDVGANIGFFSVWAARRTGRNVYAFEPHPETFARLQANVRRNMATNIVPVGRAVSDVVGVRKLFLAESHGGHLLFDHNVFGQLRDYVEVESVTLSSLFETYQLDAVDFLKMDCEGSEGHILTSTPRATLRRIGRIAMEFHDNVSPLSHTEICAILERSGFETRLAWDGKSYFGYVFGRRRSSGSH